MASQEVNLATTARYLFIKILLLGTRFYAAVCSLKYQFNCVYAHPWVQHSAD